jgi:Acetyltransferase (GNAT) domain
MAYSMDLTEPGTLSGYGHPSYAASLAEFGTPRHLRRSGGWVLERGIPGTDARDAMGSYPLFACQDWRALGADLDDLDGLVSLSLVTDPFGNYDEGVLRQCFRDVLIQFKPHFVTDLSRPIEDIVSRHHRTYARRALERVCVERCETPEQHLDEWIELYGHLIARHHLHGLKAFSRAAFAAQLRTPGIVMLRATCDGVPVGAHLWYRQGNVAQGHLAAVSPRGYEVMASYALFWFALQAFAGEVSWLNLGSGSGLAADAVGGLTAFKQGWATGTRQAYFCGRIFDRGRYDELATGRRVQAGSYFPAYRHGEFT